MTFSSSTAGNYPINVSLADAGNAGTYTNSANFTLNVVAPAPPANTAPVVSVTGVANGGSYVVGTVTPGCSVTDAQDAPNGMAINPAAGGGTAVGGQSITCSYTDLGGLPATTVTANYTITPPPDTTAPVITPNVAGTLGTNGWYTSNVTVSWTVTDAQSAITASTGCTTATQTIDTTGTTYTCSATSAGGTDSKSVTVSRDATAPSIDLSGAAPSGWSKAAVTVTWNCGDALSGATAATVSQTASTQGADQTLTGTCTDLAGNTASDTVADINIDLTAPTLSASAKTADNVTYTSGTWVNQAVTVSFTCSDGLSGTGTNPPAQILGEGENQTASATCRDVAGNESASAGVSDIDIDLTAPTNVTFTGSGFTNDATYYAGYNVPAAPAPNSCTADGAISGLSSCVVSGYGATTGPKTLTMTATDNAGNVATKILTYTVDALRLEGFFAPVDMNTTNTIKGGNAVPLKFRIWAGTTEVTNASLIGVSYVKIACGSTPSVTDEVEVLTTGATSLRYDGSQFITNWKTPTGSACYQVVVTTADGKAISGAPIAYFATRK